MSGFDTERLLDSIAGSMASLSESINVIGEPLEAAGKVIIPAVNVRVGFGAGGGSGTTSTTDQDSPQEGGGGGGGMTLTPLFLVVDAEGERILTVPGVGDSLLSAVDAFKDVLQGWSSRRERADSEGDEASEEFSDQ